MRKWIRPLIPIGIGLGLTILVSSTVEMDETIGFIFGWMMGSISVVVAMALIVEETY